MQLLFYMKWQSDQRHKTVYSVIYRCSNLVGIKLIVCCLNNGWSRLVGGVNGTPDSILCLTHFLVLYSTTCGYVCFHQQVGQ